MVFPRASSEHQNLDSTWFFSILYLICVPHTAFTVKYIHLRPLLLPLDWSQDLISKGVLLLSRMFWILLSSSLERVTPGRDVWSYWLLFLQLYPFSAMGHFKLLNNWKSNSLQVVLVEKDSPTADLNDIFHGTNLNHSGHCVWDHPICLWWRWFSPMNA